MTEKQIQASDGLPSPVCYTTSLNRWRENRHLPIEGCMLVQCTSGEAELSINSHRHLWVCGMIAVFTFDMVIVVNRKSDDFTLRSVIAGFDLSQDVFFTSTSSGMWDSLYTRPVFKVAPDFAVLYDRWFDYVAQIQLSAPDSICNTLLRKEMENFFTVTSFLFQKSNRKTETDADKNRAWSLAIDFMGLLNRHYTRHHDIPITSRVLRISVSNSDGTIP